MYFVLNNHIIITNSDTAIVEPVVVVPVKDAVHGGVVFLDPVQSLQLLPVIITITLAVIKTSPP